MSYKNMDELPDAVRTTLPLEGRRVYAAAYNSAWEQYRSERDRRHGVARVEKLAEKAAWSAVEMSYTRDRQSGEWKLKKENAAP